MQFLVFLEVSDSSMMFESVDLRSKRAVREYYVIGNCAQSGFYMENEFILKSFDYPKKLRMKPIYNKSNIIEYLLVHIESDNYSCSKSVYLYDGPNGIINIFEKLDKIWNSQKIDLKWTSIEDDFSLELLKIDDLGHFKIKIKIIENIGADFWELITDLNFDLGTLNQIISDLKYCFKI